jgi:two-component system chemotaxis response regulator CheY
MKDFTAITLLLVDDSQTMRGIEKGMLVDLGFKQILEAANGAAALEILRSEAVDLVICDWNMPKMTGIELLETVRCSMDFYTIKFIMVTAEADKEHVLRAIESGISNYIVKPFTSKVLLDKILQVLKAPTATH